MNLKYLHHQAELVGSICSRTWKSFKLLWTYFSSYCKNIFLKFFMASWSVKVIPKFGYDQNYISYWNVLLKNMKNFRTFGGQGHNKTIGLWEVTVKTSSWNLLWYHGLSKSFLSFVMIRIIFLIEMCYWKTWKISEHSVVRETQNKIFFFISWN